MQTYSVNRVLRRQQSKPSLRLFAEIQQL